MDPTLLRNTPLFAGLPAAPLAAAAALATGATYPPDSLIAREGEPASSLQVVVRGTVQLFRSPPRGERRVIGLLRSGEALGHIEALAQAPYPWSARALDPTQVASIPYAALTELVAGYPDVGLRLAGTLARAYLRTLERFRDARLEGEDRRVAQTLLELAWEVGRKTPDGWHLGVAVDYDELACLARTSRATAVRVIRDLCQAGAIAVGRRGLVITDEARLREWL